MRAMLVGAVLLGLAGCAANVGAVSDAGRDEGDASDAAPVDHDAGAADVTDAASGCTRSPAHDQVCQDDTGHPYGFACVGDAGASGGCVSAFGWPGVECCDGM